MRRDQDELSSYRAALLRALESEAKPVSPRYMVYKLEKKLSRRRGFQRMLLADALGSLLASGEVRFTRGLMIQPRKLEEIQGPRKRRTKAKRRPSAKRRAGP